MIPVHTPFDIISHIILLGKELIRWKSPQGLETDIVCLPSQDVGIHHFQDVVDHHLGRIVRVGLNMELMPLLRAIILKLKDSFGCFGLARIRFPRCGSILWGLTGFIERTFKTRRCSNSSQGATGS